MAYRQPTLPRQEPDPFRLPDDTEESILGTELHQHVIRELITNLEFAKGPAWGVGGQTCIEGFHRSDGTTVPLYPDVFVYPRPLDQTRSTHDLTVDGPPVLIVEIASPTTARGDLDDRHGKPYSYALAGVQEYLVYDPLGEVLPRRIQAWRQGASGYDPWTARPDGRWHSRALDLSFAVTYPYLRVYAADGTPIPFAAELYTRFRGSC
jgi:Uma2 family endonuclease